MPRPMPSLPDDTRADDGGATSQVRLSTTQVAAMTGYNPTSISTAVRSGDIVGSTKDDRGRWWHDPEAVRSWARSRRFLRETADGWRRDPYWRGKGRTLTDEGFHPEAWMIDPDTGCWVWQAAVTTRGHPIAWDGTRHVLVRRVLWEQEHGPLPGGYHLRRRCGDVRCVNPSHVESRPPGREPGPERAAKPTPPTAHQVRLGPLRPA